MGKVEEASTATEEKDSHSWPAWVVWPSVILVLYVLSVGPFVMLNDKGKISHSNFFETLYWPLAWAYLQTPLHKPLGMYLHLWSKHFDKNGDLQ